MPGPLKARVYDGALESHVCAIYDANKQRVAMGDVYTHWQNLPKGAVLLATS